MKKYPTNSPEAMARILVMQMLCDGNFDPEEIDQLEHLHIYDVIGLNRKGFIQVLQDYCSDLTDAADENGQIRLIDKDRIDELLDTVDDARKRLKVAALALDIAKADREINDAELAVFSRMMKKWRLSLADLEVAFDH